MTYSRISPSFHSSAHILRVRGTRHQDGPMQSNNDTREREGRRDMHACFPHPGPEEEGLQRSGFRVRGEFRRSGTAPTSPRCPSKGSANLSARLLHFPPQSLSLPLSLCVPPHVLSPVSPGAHRQSVVSCARTLSPHSGAPRSSFGCRAAGLPPPLRAR